MGYVRGSHRWDIHAANVFASQMPIPGSTLNKLPDIEGNESDYDVVYYPANPGDVIVHHVRTVHGSTGNTPCRHRRALALRYLGDDARYLVREGAPSDSQMSPNLKSGDLMDSEDFNSIRTVDQGKLPLRIWTFDTERRMIHSGSPAPMREAREFVFLLVELLLEPKLGGVYHHTG